MTDPQQTSDIADQIEAIRQVMEYQKETVASARTLGRARDRRNRQTLSRIKALISGGWLVEFEPRKHLGLQTSTRGERRRIQLGRS